MAEKTANFNVPVEKKVADEFEEWQSSLPGKKGDKLTGALKAIQAIHRIDGGLAYKLMSASTSIDDAVKAIRGAVEGQAFKRALEQMTPEERTKLLWGGVSIKAVPSGKK